MLIFYLILTDPLKPNHWPKVKNSGLEDLVLDLHITTCATPTGKWPPKQPYLARPDPIKSPATANTYCSSYVWCEKSIAICKTLFVQLFQRPHPAACATVILLRLRTVNFAQVRVCAHGYKRVSGTRSTNSVDSGVRVGSYVTSTRSNSLGHKWTFHIDLHSHVMICSHIS